MKKGWLDLHRANPSNFGGADGARTRDPRRDRQLFADVSGRQWTEIVLFNQIVIDDLCLL